MIYSVSGKIIYSDLNYVVVECSGVGFKCNTSLNTLREIGQVGSDVTLFTYLAVREDSLDLFGFKTQTELEAFKLLISVSGIGPKAGVAILSEMSPDRLALAIAGGDSKSITKAQGVGKKTAERVVLELKDKMGNFLVDDVAKNVAAVTEQGSNTAEAVAALAALGFSHGDAAAVVGSMDSSLSVDDMIRLGLKQLASNL